MKKTFSIMITAIFTGILAFIQISNVLGADKDQGEKKYTAYNLWYVEGKEDDMWAINYKTGLIIPVGTEVTDIKIKKNKITFVTVADQKEYSVNFNKKFHPDKTIEDYAAMMFTENDLDRITQGMTQTEMEGIKEGVLKIGMSKKAVIVAYGYPPEHRTPDLYGNVWLYWMNRFNSKAINFDDSGKTIKPEQPDNL